MLNSKLFQSVKQIIQNQQLEEKADNSQDIIQINNMNGTERTIKCVKDILSLEIDFNKTSIKEVRESTLIKCYELFMK